MRTFFLKLLILIIAVVFIQVLFGRFVVPKITGITLGAPGIAAIDRYLDDRYSIIYFGDSTVRAVAPEDTDTSSIAEMFSRLRPSDTVGDVSSPAYHGGIFEAMVHYISKADHPPKAMIIPINLRSFSPGWDMSPGYQFEKEIFFLTHGRLVSYFSKPVSVFRAIKTDTVTQEEFEAVRVYYGTTSVGTVKEFEKRFTATSPTTEDIKGAYIYNYMYRLEGSHPKMEAFNRLIDIAQKSGIKVYVYMTPIDYGNGTKYVGKDFEVQVKLNALLACSIVKEKGVPCLNLALDLDPSYFAHGDFPSEHLNEKGRRFVAQKIDEFLPKEW